jgi:hypothetical protein
VPPRYVYWTIIVDGQPTAFRSGSLEDIMPTFNRLKEKQPTAELKWFQNGQLWPSRHDAQDFARARGERGRAKDPRQSDTGGEKRWDAKPAWKTRSTFSPRGEGKPAWKPKGDAGSKPAWVPKGEPSPEKQSSSWDEEPEAPSPKPQASSPAGKPEWKPKGSFTPAPRRDDDKPSFAKATEDRPAGQARSDRKPEWKPKGTFKPKEAGHSDGWGEKPGFKAKSDRGERPSFAKDGDKPAWKPKGASSRSFGDRPDWKSKGDKPWKPKGSTGGKSEWKPKGDAGGKPEWKPKGTFTPKEDGHRPSARDQARSSFRPKSYTPKEDDGRTRASRVQSKNDKLDWKPKGAAPRGDGPNGGFAKSDPDAPKRKWVPKEEYKKSMGIEVKRDDKWRPGGVHRDPKQKYKDAKKAKWGRFKEAIRSRSAKPRKPKDE